MRTQRTVQKLIREAGQPRVFTLQGAALKDLKTVLAANELQPHRLKRVSMDRFRDHLQTVHGIQVSRCAFADYLRRELGHGWDL